MGREQVSKDNLHQHDHKKADHKCGTDTTKRRIQFIADFDKSFHKFTFFLLVRSQGSLRPQLLKIGQELRIFVGILRPHCFFTSGLHFCQGLFAHVNDLAAGIGQDLTIVLLVLLCLLHDLLAGFGGDGGVDFLEFLRQGIPGFLTDVVTREGCNVIGTGDVLLEFIETIVVNKIQRVFFRVNGTLL